MKKSILMVTVFLLAVANIASAITIRGIDIDFVTIGNAGNAADTGGTPGRGAVSYDYRIGKCEISNAQWNTFTAAAGVPTGNDGGYGLSALLLSGAQQPTNCVSWYEALQFCNYLTSGDKSKGVYRFSGNNTNPGDFLYIDRDAAKVTYGTIYFLPTEDEWYKAAYHKNDGVTDHYWLYPTQSNSTPSNDLINPDPGNNANFVQDGYTIGEPDWLTTIGEFENSDSAYGTFDQGGNVFEWNENLFYGTDRGLCGGSYIYSDTYFASSSRSIGGHLGRLPTAENYDVGFRVASIPEPTTLLLLGLGGLVLKRRKKNGS